MWNRPVSKPQRRGILIILSSPSGAGKSTLSRRLLEFDPGGALLDLGDDPAAAAGRAARGGDYFFKSRREFEAMVARRRDARARRGLRQPLRHAAGAGRGGDRARAGRALRRRLAGRPAESATRACATRWSRSSSCRRRSPSWRAGCAPAARTRRRSSPRAWRSRATRSATGPSTTTCWSTRTWRSARRSFARSSRPSGCAATGGRSWSGWSAG